MVRASRILLVLAAIAAACSHSPGAPSDPSGTGTPAVDGVTVSAIDGRPIGSVAIKVGSRTGVSDASGGFHIGDLAAGTLSATFSAATLVERRTSLVAPTAEAARVSLIPADFDLAAFDEMFRGTSGRLTRWVAPPPLVVVTSVMQYTTGARDDYVALSEQLTDDETTLLIDHLTSALALLTGNTFTAFASVSRESASAGSRVLVRRPGTIVVGRYKGVEGLLNTIGFGSWSTNAAGEVTSGTMFLDRDFDRNNETRWLLRTHELGHTLGYNHVTTRRSIMNPVIGPEPTQFDRDGSVIAFERRPGNQSPDIDPGVQAPGGGFGAVPLPGAVVRTVVCGPRP